MIPPLPGILESVEQISQGKLHPRELVDHCLNRIEQFDERVRAWVLVDAQAARCEADRLAGLARDGRLVGPLHGIPIGIKDIVDVRGWPTQAGSPLRAGHRADRDAPIVSRLRSAGAILLGKTVTTEFACFDPAATRNPWNLAHTPGGSSSGSAAGVAMEMCLAAVGSQTGGSITRPASFCGVAGLKPTHGRLPLEGIVPVSARLDHPGPIARHVGDLAVMYAVMADDCECLGRFRTESTNGPPGLSVIEEFFFETADAAVAETTRAALDRLAHTCSLSSLSLPPSFGRVAESHRRIMATDAAAYHRETFRSRGDQYSPAIRQLIEKGLETREDDFAAAVAHQEQFRRELDSLLTGGRIAVTPATRTPAPASLDTTGDPAFNSPWSYAGLPTVSVPCGLAPNGMPCSLQLIGAAGTEPHLLAAAAWCERQLRFQHQPPLLAEL